MVWAVVAVVVVLAVGAGSLVAAWLLDAFPDQGGE